MAARNFPIPEITRAITIGSNFVPSQAGIVIGYGDIVSFTNNSGSNITIQFLPNSPGLALYPNMTLAVTAGSTSNFTAPSVDCAANYNVVVNGVVQNAYPYVIQVGNGPMYVLITGTLNNPDFAPGDVAVPLGNITTGMGKLQMQSQVPNVAFAINFGTNPFNPGITQSGPAQPVKAGTAPGQYGYTSPSQIIMRAGGGKVIIQN
ncbi:MAG TPA: hypothetical protein VMI10_05110 [Terriglobales bacterium]|nr:hypothetical protein [Terriglobales bacterium]